MLIRSNRPFQGGGNGETIVPEKSRPLKVAERRNGGRKQMVGCQEYLPFSLSFLSLSLTLHFLSPVNLSLVSVNWQSWNSSRHYNLLKTLPKNHTPLTEPLFISRVSNTHSHSREKSFRGRAKPKQRACYCGSFQHKYFPNTCQIDPWHFLHPSTPFCSVFPAVLINHVKWYRLCKQRPYENQVSGIHRWLVHWSAGYCSSADSVDMINKGGMTKRARNKGKRTACSAPRFSAH